MKYRKGKEITLVGAQGKLVRTKIIRTVGKQYELESVCFPIFLSEPALEKLMYKPPGYSKNVS